MIGDLLKTVKESCSFISKNKKTTLILFFIQILFFISVLSVGAIYTAKIIQDIQTIFENYDQFQPSPTAEFNILQGKSPMQGNPELITESYNNIKKSLAVLIFFLWLIHLIFNGLVWYLIDKISRKKKFNLKALRNYLMKFFVMGTFVFLFFFVICYSLISVMVIPFMGKSSLTLPLFLLGVVGLYFSYISIPLLSTINLKDVWKRTIRTGVKNIPYLVLSYGLVIALLAACLYVLNAATNLAVIIILGTLFIALVLWAKLFLYNVVKKISN